VTAGEQDSLGGSASNDRASNAVSTDTPSTYRFTAHDLPIRRAGIKKLIPHRDPLLLIDRITDFTDQTITVEADLNPDWVVFKGHFPNMPIMPGVLIIETVAQAGALLVALTQNLPSDKFMALSGVDSAKFKKPLFPNETISVELAFEKIRPPVYKFTGHVSSGGRRIASVSFTAAEMKMADLNTDVDRA